MSRDHWITVKATKSGNIVEFEPICAELWDGEKFIFNKTKLGMRKGDNHLLKFVLDDRTNLDLAFPTFPDDAMWVKRIPDVNSYSSPGNTDHDYEVLRPLNVMDNGKLLMAINRNSDHRKWAFSLNFLDSNGNPHIWDPIGDNEDGGQGLVPSSLLAYVAVAAGAGIVSALVTTVALGALR